MITGVVLARNEACHIVECLTSLRPHVAELLLIDMESTDETVQLARPHVDQVLSHPLVLHFDAARNTAIDQGRFDWFWFLDADERVPELTGEQVNRLVRQRGHECVAITIPFQSFFCGKWIQHCGWWPGYTMPRVLKRGHFRFAERLHGGVEFHGPELRLPADPELAIKHYSYRSLEHYLEKFNRYTSAEAAALRDAGQALSWQDPLRAMLRDLWLYFEKNEGHQDGQHGWILSWLAGQYRWFSHAKLLDLQPASAEAAVPPNLDDVLDLLEHELARLRSARPQLPLGVVWRSPIFDPSGYADDARGLLRSLAEGPRPLAVQEIRWSERACPLPPDEAALLRALCRARRPASFAAVTSCIPTLCQPEPAAALNILRTTFETDRIPDNWPALLEQYDEIWVFTTHDKIAFCRSGVAPEKIRILPSFVDTQRFSVRGKKRKFALPDATQGRFVFLSVFDWQLRKGWDVLLRAYCQEFAHKDGAALLLKITTAHGHSTELVRSQADAVLEQLSQSLTQRTDVVIWQQTLAAEEMPDLYRSADAFVLASRGEGWGRPYMEAMACGLPVIGTRGAGNEDFMTDRNSFLVDTQQVEVPEQAAAEIPVYRGHRWLQPDGDDLRRKLRAVYQDTAKRKRLARRAVRDIRRHFSLEQAREAVQRNLQAAEQRFTTEPLPAPPEGALRVELEGEFFAHHSFSNINEQLSLQMSQSEDIALSVRRVRRNPTDDRAAPHAHRLRPYFERHLEGGPEITIRHAFPPNWTIPEQGVWVHIQPWEFGALPRDWVAPLRDHVDEIWAPSQYVRHVYERSGIPAEKIQVIPWGIDPDVFRPDAPPLFLPTGRRFVFLFVGGTIRRKGIDQLLEAYLAEFSARDDVALVIKDLGTQSFYRYGNFREEILEAQQSPTAAQIVYLDGNFTAGQLASLYTACNCLVAPYRGEGFGLPILEAMACGLAPIVPRGGASDDFTDKDSAYVLPATQVECDHDWRLCGPASELAIDPADLRAALRQAFERSDQTRAKALQAQQVRSRYTWWHTAQRMLARLPHLRRTPPQDREAPVTAVAAAVPTITACMLTQNHERTVGDSLARVRPFVDEVILLDAGSSDRTVTIAAEYGARVYRGDFVEDLSLLRNATLRKATSDWILVVDGDEYLEQRDAGRLRELLGELTAQVQGLRLCLQADQEGSLLPDSPLRLFRNHHQILYCYRAMEDVGPSIERLVGRTEEAHIHLHRKMQGHNRHPLRSTEVLLRMLHQDLIERRTDPLTRLHLGMAHFALRNYFHAECYLNDFLDGDACFHPYRQISAELLIESHLRKGDRERAREVGQRLEAVSTHARQPVPSYTMPPGAGARLYLGAGRKRLAGYVHVDLRAAAGIDVVHDLNCLPWPWDDDSIAAIVAEDVVEHLDVDLVRFCNEAWRVLHPGGELFIRTPHHQGESSWIDPTHRWHLNEQAFHYLDPDTQWGQLYPHYTDRKWHILSLGVRGPQNIHALLKPRK